MMSNHRLAGLAAAGAIAIGVAACGGGSTVNTSSGSSSPAASSSATAAASSTTSAAGASQSTAGASAGGKGAWVMGSVIDLTGTDAAGGAAEQKGIDYELAQINGAGGVRGHKLAVKYCDASSTPAGGSQCAQQLAGVNTHVVLAQGVDPPTRAALPYLTHDVVVAVDPVLLPKAGTGVYQSTTPPLDLTETLANAAKAAGMHTIGVLYTTDTSGTAQLAAAKQAAAKTGLKVVSEAQDAGSSDVTPQLVKLRSAGADVIFLASVGTNTAAAVNSYKTLGMSQPIVVGAAAVTNGFLHSLSSIPDHMYGVSHLLTSPAGLPPATAKAFATYIKQFKTQEGQPADTQTTSAVYDACVAADALKAAGPSAPAMNTFLKSKPIDCLGASLRFNVPGLNVPSGERAALVQAGTSASDGWGALSGKL
jgi:branched-chain amino acid transport system substrate-binding protein